jgi:hypothetical protein
MYTVAQPGVAGAPQWPRGGLVTGQIGQGRARKSWFSSQPALVKLGALFLGLVLVGVGIQSLLPSAPKCVYSCTVRTGPLEPAGETYSGSPLFSFDYPPSLSVQSPDQLGSTVTLDNGNGGVIWIWAGQGQQSLTGLVQQYAQKLGGNVQDVSALGPIWGAEIGFVPGAGEFYSAQLQTQSGQDIPVGAGVIAAQTGGTWAVIMVLTTCTDADNGQLEDCSESLLQSQQENFGNSQAYDDVLGRWHWANE